MVRLSREGFSNRDGISYAALACYFSNRRDGSAVKSLPFKITAQSKGAQKAFRRITNRYGTDKGPQVFLDRAEEHGVGNTIRQKVNSVYKKGGGFKDG